MQMKEYKEVPQDAPRDDTVVRQPVAGGIAPNGAGGYSPHAYGKNIVRGFGSHFIWINSHTQTTTGRASVCLFKRVQKSYSRGRENSTEDGFQKQAVFNYIFIICSILNFLFPSYQEK